MYYTSNIIDDTSEIETVLAIFHHRWTYRHSLGRDNVRFRIHLFFGKGGFRTTIRRGKRGNLDLRNFNIQLDGGRGYSPIIDLPYARRLYMYIYYKCLCIYYVSDLLIYLLQYV